MTKKTAFREKTIEPLPDDARFSQRERMVKGNSEPPPRLTRPVQSASWLEVLDPRLARFLYGATDDGWRTVVNNGTKDGVPRPPVRENLDMSVKHGAASMAAHDDYEYRKEYAKYHGTRKGDMDWTTYVDTHPVVPKSSAKSQRNIIARVLIFFLKMFNNKKKRKTELALPPHETVVDSGPYRTRLQVESEIPVKSAADIMVIVGNDTRKCPVCNHEDNEKYNRWSVHKAELCTPFHRVVLKKRFLRHNIVCHLRGAHSHCECYIDDCKTRWIVVKNDVTWTHLVENADDAIAKLDKEHEKVAENISDKQKLLDEMNEIRGTAHDGGFLNDGDAKKYDELEQKYLRLYGAHDEFPVVIPSRRGGYIPR